MKMGQTISTEGKNERPRKECSLDSYSLLVFSNAAPVLDGKLFISPQPFQTKWVKQISLMFCLPHSYLNLGIKDCRGVILHHDSGSVTYSYISTAPKRAAEGNRASVPCLPSPW